MTWCQGRNHLSCRKGQNPQRLGFTLVELLVVIGIISVLIGVLLPALNKARESSRQAKCLNNMRQIAVATVMFAQENKGWMPGRGGTGITKVNLSGGIVNGAATDASSPADWIAWQRKIGPITGLAYSGAADQNITYSALARYMSIKSRTHTTPQEANTVAIGAEEVFRCPSDNLQSRVAYIDGPGGRGPYAYSYSMNILFTNPIYTPVDPLGVGFKPGQRFGSTFTGRISGIRNSSEKVLLICEDENTIDDGTFNPNASQWNGGKVNAVASRHELKFKKAASFGNTTSINENARGNVGFCDGHGEFMSRKDAISQKYSGNPVPDPAGF